MKIAVCYSGILGDNFELCYQHHSYVLHLYQNDVDYFIHTSNTENFQRQKNYINEHIRPKTILVDSYENNNNIYYCVMKADLLRKNFQLVTKTKYDCVIRLDFNIGFEYQIDLNMYDMNKLNILKKENHRGYNLNFYNYLAFSNTNIMDIYSVCYDYFDLYQEINKIEVDKIGEYHLQINNIIQNKLDMDSFILYDDTYIKNNNNDIMNETNTKICLIVAFYFGERTKNETIHNLIPTHERFLNKYKHNLSNIVFVIAEDHRNEIKIEKDIKTGITFFYKPNNGLSFGSWHTVVNYYKKEYDYYIFCEDDYLFCMDHFDKILVHEFKKQRSPYMVTYKLMRAVLTSTIGITSSEELEKINYFNNITWTKDKTDSMWFFLNAFSSFNPISKLFSAFPYWGLGKAENIWDVWLYDYTPRETDESYKNRILLCAIQFIDEHDNIKHPKFTNLKHLEYKI